MGIEALSTEEKRQLLWESSVGYYPELSDTPQSILGRSLADIGFEQIPSLPEILC